MNPTAFIKSIILTILFPIYCCGENHFVFHLDHQDGLSSNHIRSISQDSRGFVWVATLKGLNRFDGKEFKSFTKENSGLSSNELNSIVADPINPDIIWISTRHDGFCRYDYSTGAITQFKKETMNKDIPFLSLSNDNKIWITTYYSSPLKLDTSTEKAEPLYEKLPEGMPDHFWCVKEAGYLPFLYMGHDGGGFTIVNLKDKQFKNYTHNPSDPHSLSGNHVYSILPCDDGTVWLGTDKGISIYDPSEESFHNILSSDAPNTLLPGPVMSICQLSNGDIWFGTHQGGVSILSASNRAAASYSFINLSTVVSNDEVLSPHVQTLYEDSFGNKWIGNVNDGIDVVAHNTPFFTSWKPFPIANSTRSHQAVWSSISDQQGNLWLGGEEEIVRIGHNHNQVYKLPLSAGKYSTVIRTLYFENDDTLWIGTNNDGAFIFNIPRETFTKIEIPEREVRAFLKQDDGSILIGTIGGLYCCNGTAPASRHHLDSLLKDHYVTALYKDSKGNLWIETFGKGLAIFSPNGENHALMKGIGDFPSFTINSLREDSHGRIWAATRDGVASVNINNLKDIDVFTTNDGLPDNHIKSIEEDSSGNVWISSNKGIAKYNPKTQKINSYHKTHGRQMSSFTENCSGIDSQENLFFGSLNGLTSFNLHNLSNSYDSNTIKLSGIFAQDSHSHTINSEIEIPVSNKITIPYYLNNFSVKFCNPDITQTANSDFCYNMAGINEVWTLDNGSNEAIYRNLKPGTYQFRVMHRLNGKEWSAPIELATITITPPLYLAWWAKTIYILAAITILMIILYFYKHKIDLEKNLAIERENSKNNQIMNEERMMFFTNITHELRTPLSLIVGPIEDLVNDADMTPGHRKKLLTIHTSAMRLLNLINGILEFRKTETQNKRLEVVNGNLANFIREIGIRFKELNNNPDLNITIDVSEMEGINMFFDPEMITMILNNLIGNAVKYTKSGVIRIALQTSLEGGIKYADISVSDTGEGISKEELPHIFERYYQAKHNRKVSGTGIGLALTKNLVELHEGSISVKSEHYKGSTFTVRLIADNSYPNAIHKEVAQPTDDKGISESSELTESRDKLSILIVEDDYDVREYIYQFLSDKYNVITAADGREGLEKVFDHAPDIIVSDIMMPVMDGIKLCSKIKSDPNISHIPVILLTAKDSLLDKEQGYAVGADSYITKPFSGNLLKARIQNILESRHRLIMRMLDDESKEIANKTSSENDETDKPDGNEIKDETKKIELTPFDSEFIAKFKTLTIDNIEIEELDIAFFTDKMCMSHSTLYRKVKSITGYTPNEFIRKIKIHKAAEMLMTGKVALADIPFRTGFNSSAYFRRVFKKEFGMSPTEYITQNMGQDSYIY